MLAYAAPFARGLLALVAFTLELRARRQNSAFVQGLDDALNAKPFSPQLVGNRMYMAGHHEGAFVQGLWEESIPEAVRTYEAAETAD